MIIRECNFQDLALADKVPFAVVKESDGHFGDAGVGDSVDKKDDSQSDCFQQTVERVKYMFPALFNGNQRFSASQDVKNF